MSPLFAVDADVPARLIVLVVVALVLLVRGALKKNEPRKPAEGHGVPHPSGGPPPTVPWPKWKPQPTPAQAPRPPVASTRPVRRKPGEPMVLAPPPAPHPARKEEPGSGDLPVPRAEAPAADFDSSRDLTRRTAAVMGGTESRPVLMKGRALLRAGEMTRSDRIRAAIVWSEVLRPPVALRGPRTRAGIRR